MIRKQLATAMIVSTLLGIAFTARAADDLTSMTKSCESAKLSAWFDRQRQITEGDTDYSTFAVPTPRECVALQAAKDAAKAAKQEGDQPARSASNAAR